MAISLTEDGLVPRPVGQVVQTKRTYITSGNTTTEKTYASGGSSSGTLDSSTIYELKNVAGHALNMDLTATSGNLLVGWFTYMGINSPASACAYAFGIEWGSAARRTYSTQGYNNQVYMPPAMQLTSVILDADLDNVKVRAIIRLEELNKTFRFRNWGANPAATNYGTLGATNVTTDYYMIVQEIQQ